MQLHFADRMHTLIDSDNGLEWKFDFHRMQFVGTNIKNGEFEGYLGAPGRTDQAPQQTVAFNSVPRVVGNGAIVTDVSLYQYDPKTKSVVHRFSVSPDERIIASPQITSNCTALLTNQNLYLLDRQQMEDELDSLDSFGCIRLPASWKNLSSITLGELFHGVVVEFVFGRPDGTGTGYYPASQAVWQVGFDNSEQELSNVNLEYDFPEEVNMRGLFLSPILNVSLHLLNSVMRPEGIDSLEPARIWNHRYGPRSLFLLLSIAVICAVISAWLAKRQGLGRFHTWCWTLSALVTGIPSVLSMYLLMDKPKVRK